MSRYTYIEILKPFSLTLDWVNYFIFCVTQCLSDMFTRDVFLCLLILRQWYCKVSWAYIIVGYDALEILILSLSLLILKKKKKKKIDKLFSSMSMLSNIQQNDFIHVFYLCRQQSNRHKEGRQNVSFNLYLDPTIS